MSTFSERLRELRNEAGLSQKDLASQIKSVSKSSINMYERGEREPSFETLELIADYFNVDMDYLLGKANIKNLYRAIMGADSDIDLDAFVKEQKPIHDAIRKMGIGIVSLGAGPDGSLVFKMRTPKGDSLDDVTSILLTVLRLSEDNDSHKLRSLCILSELISCFEESRQDDVIKYAEYLDAVRQQEYGIRVSHRYQQKR